MAHKDFDFDQEIATIHERNAVFAKRTEDERQNISLRSSVLNMHI
jgi:hypothetical protein